MRAPDRRTPVLPATESGPRNACLRRVCGGAVRAVLRRRGGTAESDAGNLLPPAVDRGTSKALTRNVVSLGGRPIHSRSGTFWVSTDSEEILHDSVNRRESLELSGRLEAPHLALPLTRRLVGDFGSIVRVLISDVDHRRHHGAARGGVGAQLVGDQSSRDTALGV